MNNIYNKFPEAMNSLPVGDMTTVNAAGDEVNTIVYDRPIYAIPKSRNFAQGDRIRGDLAIIPQPCGWFRPSSHPNIDLQPGAINVMAGINNESGKDTANLIYQTSAGGQSAIGGVNMSNFFDNLKSVDMNNQFSGSYGAAGRDVKVTAFP